MVAVPEIVDGDGLAFKIPDRAHTLVTHQFVATTMNTGEHDDRHASVHIGDQSRGGPHCNIRSPFSEGTGSDSCPKWKVLDIGESIQPQQLFREILRREANRWRVHETNPGGVERWLRNRRAAEDR